MNTPYDVFYVFVGLTSLALSLVCLGYSINAEYKNSQVGTHGYGKCPTNTSCMSE